MEEGQSMSSYVLKMKSYIDNLERLGHSMSQNLAVSLILVSLSKEYDSFVQNCNTHGMWETVTGLHAMLKLHEQTLPKKNVALVLMQFKPMDANQTTNNNSIRSTLDKEKLNGSNFLDWYPNLRIVLRNKQKLPHLEEALPKAPLATATDVVRNAYTCRVAEQQEVACLMLVSMTPEIQKNLEDRTAFEILQELEAIFQQQAEQELFETVKAFHACKQEEGQSVSTYVLRMKAYLDQMEPLGYPMPLVPRVKSKILKSQARGKGKKRGKGKSKLAYDPKHKTPPPQPAKKEHPTKDTGCHHCHKTGHWKRNCPLYLAELKKKKASTSGISGIFTIELYSFPKSNSWIYDTGCGTHICNTIQGLRGFPKLNKGALDLYVGNSNSAAVEAIGSFDLILPSGMILVLDNFSKDNVFYFNVIPRDGIFEIDMHNHVSNERSIYTCSNKKSKHNLDFTFLWHCRLGHINKKRIAKLQHDGILKSIDDESFDVCVSCISSKMERKLFTHTSERADDLLGIIHNDVCRPFRTTSREDRGGEYLSQEFLDHLRSRGIISQLTPPYTPQHNGVSERRNQTLLDMVRSMMSLNTLPMSFWGYALESAARILNMVPTEKNSLISQEASGSTVDFDEIQRQDAHPSKNTIQHQPEVEHDDVDPQTDVNLVCRSARIPQSLERYGFCIDAEEHELGDHGEPPNYQAALSDPKSEKWLEAMNAEMQSMKDNHVWNLVKFLPNYKIVGSKWLIKKKTDMDGNIHTYKARLVAKGFTQTYRVDYEETFSTVADIKDIRILIAIAAYYDYEIWQMDVKTSFLNGRLNKDVYMGQPEGFVNPKHPRRFRYREYDLAHLKIVFEFSIYTVWKSVQYGVSNGLDTAYWGFLGVGTTFDIFQNIIMIPYLKYGVLSPLDTAYCSLIFSGLW
ncbi:retrotransposon protein, putative, ty1-copia subclass [Tanacetum coccineum]